MSHTQIDVDALGEHYAREGWVVVDFPDRDAILRLRDTLERGLREITGVPDATLATYHDVVAERSHAETHWRLANYFWDQDLGFEVARSQLALFRPLIGCDLHVQRRPFLRVARPGRTEDNIGLHRDTFYGQSPYEVTVHFPWVDLDADSALCLVPGTGTRPEDAYHVVPTEEGAVEKDSPKHRMGFPYAPKRMLDDFADQLRAIPLRVGQALVFTPAMVHGQIVNRGASTRVTTDLRIVNTLAPVQIRKDELRGYSRLCQSGILTHAQAYHASLQAAEAEAACDA